MDIRLSIQHMIKKCPEIDNPESVFKFLKTKGVMLDVDWPENYDEPIKVSIPIAFNDVWCGKYLSTLFIFYWLGRCQERTNERQNKRKTHKHNKKQPVLSILDVEHKIKNDVRLASQSLSLVASCLELVEFHYMKKIGKEVSLSIQHNVKRCSNLIGYFFRHSENIYTTQL